MICCDRCEEWFHGDCVGISEARGRLLERNGEDYICPHCTILQVQDERSAESAGPQAAGPRPADADGADLTSVGTVEQTSGGDQGIKGRIEKAANPSGKKKLKIFQPVSTRLPRPLWRDCGALGQKAPRPGAGLVSGRRSAVLCARLRAAGAPGAPFVNPAISFNGLRTVLLL